MPEPEFKDSHEQIERTVIADGLDQARSDDVPAPSSEQPYQAGARVLGNYEFVRLIGTGGMGVVYECRQPVIGKSVAIKFLHSHLLTGPTLKRFQQEGQTAAMLSHANLISVLDLGVSGSGQPYIVMEYASGASLAETIKREGPLPVKRAVDIFMQICDALSYAHKQGVLHRDLKPANVMLSGENEQVKIVDFGIAKIQDLASANAESMTKTGEILGSPFYISPEQIKATKLDERSDFYSLGCLMFETLTGRPPYSGATAVEILIKHETATPPRITEQKVPSSLEDLIRTLLAKNPIDRIYKDAGEIKRVLMETVSPGGRVIAAKKNAPLEMRRLALPAFAASVILVVAALAYLAWSGLKPPPAPAPVSTVPMAELSPAIPSTDDDEVRRRTAEASSHIDLRAFKLTANGLAPLARQPHIKELKLDDLIAPPEVFASLKDTRIDRMSLHDSLAVTDEGLRYIGQIKSLGELDLAYKAKDGSSRITNNGMKYLANMPHLEALECEGQEFIGNDGVKNLLPSPRMAHLGLRHTATTDGVMEILKKFPALEGVSLAATAVTNKALGRLKELKNISHVNLSQNEKITDEGIDGLRNTRLSKLILDRDLITDKGLYKLAALKGFACEKLGLSNTNVTEKGVLSLRPLHLKQLNLAGCRFNAAACERLRLAMPDCEINFDARKKF